MSNYIFRRRPKDDGMPVHYFNVSTGERWCEHNGEKYSHTIRLNKIHNSTYHPIEPYTGVNDCKRNEQYPEGQMIFKGDILTADEYLYKEDGKRNYDGIVCWDYESASFYVHLKCVNTDKRGISNGMSHNFGDGYTYEVIGSVEE